MKWLTWLVEAICPIRHYNDNWNTLDGWDCTPVFDVELEEGML